MSRSSIVRSTVHIGNSGNFGNTCHADRGVCVDQVGADVVQPEVPPARLEEALHDLRVRGREWHPTEFFFFFFF